MSSQCCEKVGIWKMDIIAKGDVPWAKGASGVGRITKLVPLLGLLKSDRADIQDGSSIVICADAFDA